MILQLQRFKIKSELMEKDRKDGGRADVDELTESTGGHCSGEILSPRLRLHAPAEAGLSGHLANRDIAYSVNLHRSKELRRKHGL